MTTKEQNPSPLERTQMPRRPSKLPWHAVNTDVQQVEIRAASGRLVAVIDGHNAGSDADLIVAAVNGHASLKEHAHDFLAADDERGYPCELRQRAQHALVAAGVDRSEVPGL